MEVLWGGWCTTQQASPPPGLGARRAARWSGGRAAAIVWRKSARMLGKWLPCRNLGICSDSMRDAGPARRPELSRAGTAARPSPCPRAPDAAAVGEHRQHVVAPAAGERYAHERSALRRVVARGRLARRHGAHEERVVERVQDGDVADVAADLQRDDRAA